MWPARGCIVGGSAPQGVYGDSDSYANVPTRFGASAIWGAQQSAFYLNNSFHGLEWPTLPDPNLSSCVVIWHGDRHGGTVAGNSGTLRMSSPLSWLNFSIHDVDGVEVPGSSAAGLLQSRRIGGLYAMKGPGYVIHNLSNAISLAADFTLEGWFCPTSTPGVNGAFLWDWRAAVGTVQPVVYLNIGANLGKLTYYRGGTGDLIIGAAPSLNTWHHFAVSRNSNTVFLYLDGVSQGSVVDATAYANANGIRIGQSFNVAGPIVGFFDEFRCTKGVGRYPSGTSFTPPTSYPDS